MYAQHPSPRLNELFRARPFQGAAPEESKFLFVGLDANYAPAIEHSNVFRSIVEYHEDGVTFWRRHGVHHPFMLPAYRGDGWRYHLNFSRIGFTKDDAHRVSFVELLHVPTVGRSDLQANDLDPAHLESLNAVIASGKCQHVFISARVALLMRKTRQFPWLNRAQSGSGPLPIVHRNGDTTVYRHLHFANYGKFQKRLSEESAAIARLIGAPAGSRS